MPLNKNIQNKIQAFKQAITNQTLRQSYLFYGYDPETQLSFAKSLANLLETNAFEEPKKTLLDALIVEPDEKNSIGIDQSRAAERFLYQMPYRSPRRTVIVGNGECLTPEAQSALLKLTEEPPPHGLVIFITRDENALLPTLASRLSKVYFPSRPRPSIRNAEDIDLEFNKLYNILDQDLIKNSAKLAWLVSREELIKRYNVNKHLQLRALTQYLKI